MTEPRTDQTIEAPPRPKRQRRSWRRRIVRGVLALIVVGPLIGWAYEQYAVRRDARRFPPPGQFVQVEPSRRVHYVCSGPVLPGFSGGGSGSPLVLFEVSGFSNSLSFREARAGLSQHTRVCSYDRMGIGWSDPGPATIPVTLLADDLRKLLDAVSPDAPAVLVASSIGGVTAEFFARQHPERVAGLVFLDAGNSLALRDRFTGKSLPALATVACSALRAAGAIALVRLWDPWRMRSGQSEQSARSAAVMYGAKPWVMLCAMVRAGEATLSAFEHVPQLRREIPITALSAETNEEFLPPALAGWIGLRRSVDELRESHKRLAQSSARGIWRVVPGSSHLIASSRPQAAIDAVREMISLIPDP
jgi:pimeloyl-ACP methyl ester carboxylesterase